MKPLYLDVPSLTLEKRAWIQAMEEQHQDEADRAMGLIPVLMIIFGTLLTAIGMVVWG